MEETTEATASNYNKRPIWQWIVLYLIIAAILYGAFYYFFLAKNNGVNYNSQAPANTSPTQSVVTTAPEATEEDRIHVTLDEVNSSGESGTALLKEEDGKTIVTVSLIGFTDDFSQPAHIHIGSCPGVGAVKYPLTNVVNGSSVTELNETLSDIKSQLSLAINIHKSAAEITSYTACGELPSE